MEVDRTILHRTIRRMLAITAGIVLIAVGIAGLFVPLLPGWPFIAAGIILLWPKTWLAIWLKHLPARIREYGSASEEICQDKTNRPIRPMP